MRSCFCKTKIERDEYREIQDQHNDDPPSFLAFEQVASEVDDDRYDGEKEAVRACVDADKVGGDDGVGRDFQDDTYINRHDAAVAAKEEAECIDYDAQDVHVEQRPDAGDQHDDQKHAMNQTHDAYGNGIDVLGQVQQKTGHSRVPLLGCFGCQ